MKSWMACYRAEDNAFEEERENALACGPREVEQEAWVPRQAFHKLKRDGNGASTLAALPVRVELI